MGTDKEGLYKNLTYKVILELKVTPMITKVMLDQIFYYIKGTTYKLVLLANFGTSKLAVKRRIYT